MIPQFLKDRQIPQKSGVYVFKNQDKRVLYVGKAINLKTRVSSYFSREVSLKVDKLVERIADIEIIVVESELEALILEANLIKKFLPPFNVRLTDDKDYLYIGLTSDAFPQVITIRKQDLKTVKRYWGPYPSAKTARFTLKSLRRVFSWCSNPPPKNKGRACFYYHLGQCLGACVGLIGKEDYRKNIKGFAKFLDGKKDELVDELTAQMLKKSQNQEFEQATKIRKILEGISYLIQPNRVSSYLENPNFLEQETKLGLEMLQRELNLKKLPERIEGYDISNIHGKEATGSMVVLTQGEIDKSQYRKFKIRLSGRPNDVGMHKEMIRRRLKHREWPFPDLIIVDGGRGQARGVNFQLSILNFQIPVYGLAKRMEWLYPPEGEVIKLKRSNPALKLLQKLRDESHRFALSYHRKLRGKIFIR